MVLTLRHMVQFCSRLCLQVLFKKQRNRLESPALGDFIPNSLHNNTQAKVFSLTQAPAVSHAAWSVFLQHFYCLDDTQWSKATMRGKDFKRQFAAANYNKRRLFFFFFF